jgi:hypothetical protein
MRGIEPGAMLLVCRMLVPVTSECPHPVPVSEQDHRVIAHMVARTLLRGAHD